MKTIGKMVFRLCRTCGLSTSEDCCPRCGADMLKSEADRKPASGLDENPTSNYVYSSNNTHKNKKEASAQKTLIFRDANIRKGFAQVPNVVLRDPFLSGNEKTLYALLLSYAWQDDECFPGQDTLAENMSLSVRSISSLLHRLRDTKLIGWKRQGLGKVNVYYIRRLSDGYLPKAYYD